MAGRRGGKRGQGTKPKAPIFPIGPGRWRRARPPLLQRIFARLTSASALALLIGTMIGAVGGDLAHDWLHPERALPTVVADAPAPVIAETAPTVAETMPVEPEIVALAAPAPAPVEPAMPSDTATEVAMAAPPDAAPEPPEPSLTESAESAAPEANAPAGADREDLGPIIAALMKAEAIAPAAGPAALPAPAVEASPAQPAPGLETPAALPEDGATPAWLAYAVPAPEFTAGRPMIAIVLDDVGLNRAHAARAIELPAPVTLSFMTYAEDLPSQAAAAHARGHELMLHVPMEPLDGSVDAGPDVLDADLPPEEIRRRLVWGLDRMTGYVGINNHMGSRFTRSIPGMAVVMQELRRRGLLFLDSMTINDSVGGRLATEYGVPHVDRDIFLDNDMDSGAVDQMLLELERVARERGYAIGIGHPHPGTLDALMQWLPQLRARGFELVPISTIVRRVTPPTG